MYLEQTKKFFYLSFALAKAEFKQRNEGSYLGVLWYLLNPLLMFGVLLFIFAKRFGGEIPNYSLYLLVGIVMFNFFRQATINAATVIRSNHTLIRSMKFSHEALVVSVVMSGLFSHIFEILVLFLFFIWLGGLSLSFLFYFLILFVYIFFILGVSFVVAALSVYFYDLVNIWSFGMLLLWLATPIFYSSSTSELIIFNSLNPLAIFISVAREVIIYNQFPDLQTLAVMVSWALLSIVVGITVFRRLKPKFAEII